MSEVRTRFSPSPTGMIHLGNIRAALFSALFAAKMHGVFILRIEDTDVARSEERFIESLQQDLHWTGIAWQEGEGKEGAYGPYRQSQRQNIYADYYKMLEEKKLIYPCFCSDQELNVARKLQLANGQPPRYAGTCRHLSQEQIAQRIEAGKKPAWRFIVPENTNIDFVDIVKGPQHFQSSDMGDFIVRRADSTAPFLFCNAVDDATMKITHVIRGEDHLANTPRQIMLFTALGLTPPQYGHLSMIVGEDGAPLSKRHGSFSVQDIRDQGYLSIAVINYMARLGHACEAQTLLDFKQLADHFYLEKISKSPARFDLTQLLYWQKMAVQALDEATLSQWLGEKVMGHVPVAAQSLFIQTVKKNIAFPTEAHEWAHILFNDHVDIEESELTVIRDAGEQFFVTAESAVQKYGIQLPQILAEMKEALGVSGKKLFMPLRAALTGRTDGPELAAIAELLGAKKMQHRLEQAVRLVRG